MKINAKQIYSLAHTKGLCEQNMKMTKLLLKNDFVLAAIAADAAAAATIS